MGGGVGTIEAEGRRESTQHGVLEERSGGDLFVLPHTPYCLLCQGATQLLTSDNFSYYSCCYITKCTQNTTITESFKVCKGPVPIYK
jgi:hypothetical protein